MGSNDVTPNKNLAMKHEKSNKKSHFKILPGGLAVEFYAPNAAEC